MRSSLFLLALVAACGPRPGTVQARWQGSQGEIEVRVEGQGSWCPETRTVLIDATQGDDAVGVFWRYPAGGLGPGEVELGLPPDSTGEPAPGSAALRYVHLDETRGYRSVSGTLTLSAADTTAVTGTLAAKMQRVGEADSTDLAMEFHAVPLFRDPTVCVAPPAPRADSSTATP
jgi:hypothetical protein